MTDNFYEEEFNEEQLELIDLDQVLEEEVEDTYEEAMVFSEREEWQLTEDEDKLLHELLEKKKKEDSILKAFKALEDKPDDETINSWKAKFGDIYLVSLSEKENFIFRALKRQEWTQLIAQTSKLPEVKKSEAIMMKAVLYPKLSQSNVAVVTAGAPETLRSLILEASNFIDPERAIQLVRKL